MKFIKSVKAIKNNKVKELVPNEVLDNKGILIGKSQNGEERIYLDDTNREDLIQNYCYIGSPRTGKDTSIVNFVVEASKRGHGFIIPDVLYGSSMVDSIRDALPKEKIVDISLDDPNFPVYFGFEDVLELVGPRGVNLVSENLIKVLDLGSNSLINTLASLIAKVCKCNLYDMYCFLRNPNYQLEVLERVMKEDELLGIELNNKFIKGNLPANVEGAILSRLDELMSSGSFKYMFAQEKNNKLDFNGWIKEGKVIILRGNKHAIGNFGTNVLIYLLSLRVYWINKTIEKDKNVFLVLNDANEYMSESLEDLLNIIIEESRYSNLCLLLSLDSVDYSRISKNFWYELRNSSLNFFLFKNNSNKVFLDMSEHLSNITLSMAMEIENYESIFIPYSFEENLEPFFLQTLLPPKERQKTFENRYLTNESKELYGTNIADVINRLIAKEKDIFNLISN